MLKIESAPKDDEMKEELKSLIEKIERIIQDLMDVTTTVLEAEIKYMIDLTVAERMLKLATQNVKTAKEELESIIK